MYKALFGVYGICLCNPTAANLWSNTNVCSFIKSYESLQQIFMSRQQKDSIKYVFEDKDKFILWFMVMRSNYGGKSDQQTTHSKKHIKNQNDN